MQTLKNTAPLPEVQSLNSFRYAYIRSCDNMQVLPIYYLLGYCSIKEFPNLNEDYRHQRQVIINFKIGLNCSEVVSKITNALKEKIAQENLPSHTICIIPASTKERTVVRFKMFCVELARKLKVENGYDFINILEDHDTTKGDCLKQILRYLNFDIEKIKGKKILLFDDVITTGISFQQCASQLIELGAEEVKGIFLSKTFTTDGTLLKLYDNGY